MTKRNSKVTDLAGVVIQSTYDQSIFNTLLGNRELPPKHVKALTDSMDAQQLATVGIVNEKMEIIDGQNRSKACGELGLPFSYIVMPGYSADEVHTLNTNTSNWKEIDYIRQNSDLYYSGMEKYEAYARIMEIVERESFHYKTSMYMLQGGKISGTKDIIGGEVRIKSNNVKEVEERIELLNGCIGILGSKAKSASFAQALVLAMGVPGFDKRTFLMKMKSGKNIILNTKTGREYFLLSFETAYNKGLSLSKNIGIKVQADIAYKQLSR